MAAMWVFCKICNEPSTPLVGVDDYDNLSIFSMVHFYAEHPDIAEKMEVLALSGAPVEAGAALTAPHVLIQEFDDLEPEVFNA